METSTMYLPVLDMNKIASDEASTAKQVVEALETTGFLYIDNVDIDFDKLYEACVWFFTQPQVIRDEITRNQWNPKNKNMFRGFYPVVPGEPSHKEAFEFGRYVDPDDPTENPENWMQEPSVWPREDGTFPFKKFLVPCYKKLFETSIEILRLVATGIGIPVNAFEEIFAPKPQSVFRLIHYPTWGDSYPERAVTEDGKVVVTPEHTDMPFMTLLTTFNYEGLEVYNTNSKQWQKVERRPNSFIMNIGDVFSRMTNGRFKAGRHRVLDIGKDRYSVPFFMSPDFNADIGLNWFNKFTGEGDLHIPERYGPWYLYMAKHVKKFVEYSGLPEFEY